VHSAVHIARPELHAAVHCHHEDATAVCMTKDGLLPLCQEALIVHSSLAVHPFEGAATDVEERPRMAQSLGATKRNMMLDNHGPLCCGSTLAEAMVSMYNLTRACQYQVKALSLVGGDLSRLNLPTAAELQSQKQRQEKSSSDKMATVYDGAKLQWQAWVRQIEKRDGPQNIYT